MMNGVTTLSRPQASEMEDSRGILCRNRRLFGTLERLRCGWAGQDREGGEGCERAGSSCLFLKELGFPVNRIGFEAGPLSQWLHAGLTQAAFEAVLLETRHVKAALSTMTVKTTARMRVGLPSCCGWDGSSRCTPNRLDRRRSERCWSRASSFSESCWMWN